MIRGCQPPLTDTQINIVGRKACDPINHSFIHSFFIYIQLIHKRSHMRPRDVELVKNYKCTN